MDASAAAHRAMGGVGCVSVSANVAPALCAALHRAWDADGRPDNVLPFASDFIEQIYIVIASQDHEHILIIPAKSR